MAKATLNGKKQPSEFALIGDVDDWEADLIEKLLELPRGGECIIYIDSSGGSVYGALAVVAMLRLRELRFTAVVLGECSSAALLIFAAAHRRVVTPYSTLLFHRMRWESEKHVDAVEARNWAGHFQQLERDIDALQARLFGQDEAQVGQWVQEGRYLTGRQVAEAGLAELSAF